MVKKGFKYFIGYKDAKKIRPLCIFLPKMNAYRKDFDETKYMSFLIKDDELLKKYNKIWKKVKILSIKNLIMILYTTEKYLKATKNLIMEKSTQIFTIIKYQKKVLNVFAYQ